MIAVDTSVMIDLIGEDAHAEAAVFGGIGLVLGLVGLVLNVATFPTPPISVGLIDVGPFVVTWYGVMFALLIRAHRKAG